MRREHDKGFTLLELVVAMTILGLVMGVLYGTLHVGLRSVSASQRKSDIFQRVRISREILSRELKSAFLKPSSSDWTVFLGDDLFGDTSVGGSDEEGKIMFIGSDGINQGFSSDRLYFNSFADYSDGSRILTSVKVMLSEVDLDGGRDLLLVRKPLYGPWEPDTVKLAGDIRGLDIKYLMMDKNNEPQWVGEWESDSELPEAIELNISWQEEIDTELRIARLPLLLYLPERPVR
jgi:prepilin-type N-terminal cleavage/methylation domain-containing protein